VKTGGPAAPGLTGGCIIHSVCGDDWRRIVGDLLGGLSCGGIRMVRFSLVVAVGLVVFGLVGFAGADEGATEPSAGAGEMLWRRCR
jgi:hypothetical protein